MASNFDKLIDLYGMCISNDRKSFDLSALDVISWSGMRRGIDGYPCTYDDLFYLIAGGKTNN